jgi:Lrp/AsnC family leucine-responsive transcriptional regulator
MPARMLDAFDRKLLQLVQHDAGLTAEALAERVGLSASAVQRRLRKLEADGSIVARIAVVDPAAVGNPATFIVALELEHERDDLLGALRHWLASVEQIQQAYYVTGAADFLLLVTAPDIAGYESLMARLMADNPNVRRYTTSVVLSAHKRGLYVPV